MPLWEGRVTEEGDVGVTVSLDGVYYHQAKRMIGSADAADKEFERWEKYLTGANAKAEELEDDPAREDDLHDLCVEIDRHWQSVDQSATELIREVAA